MPEQFCRVSPDIELCYETFGDPSDPTVLLIMGLATQMIGWPDDFCRALAERGFHVVRFDNRDIGRSTHVDAKPPTLGQLLRRSKRPAAYTLEDMAEDAAGLLRELDLAPAHVIGASMGGMIAQTLAARHPELVLSLTSIMSTTGNRWVGQPAWRLLPMLAARPAKSREATVERAEKVFSKIGSKGYEQDLEHLRDAAARSFDRGRGDAAGQARQLAAVIASGDRTRSLRRITVPTLVIHGTDDPLIKPSGGRATVRAIPNAELLDVEGMGHDLPRGAWPRILDAFEALVTRAEPARQPA
ncbi:MAG TPA: alpha/beta hydrolase [Thermoleophilaceae bacterium]|nr:alpha/beta hydrolase [Thermoleophilaceae bacterium]